MIQEYLPVLLHLIVAIGFPAAADEEGADKGEQEERPNGDDGVPKTVVTDESEQKKDRKHGQCVARHAFDERNAGEQNPVSRYPSRVNRPELEPARDCTDK